MKGAYFNGHSKIKINDLNPYSASENDVIIEMKASGLCGSDFPKYRAEKPSKFVGGHEPCGVISELGSNVKNLSVGDRVMIHHYSGCRECKMCNIGYTQMCLNGTKVFGTTYNGGHQDYMKVPDYTCVTMPDDLSFAVGAATACGTGTAYQALEKLNIPKGATLAIFGQGPVGLSATAFAAANNINVIAIDVNPYRLQLAKDIGAKYTIDSNQNNTLENILDITSSLGSEYTMEVTGIPAVRNLALDSTANWGSLCFVGEDSGKETTVQISNQIIHKQLTVKGSWTFGITELENAANHIIDNNVPIEQTITHKFTLKEIAQAYEIFENGECGKVMIEW